MCNDRKSRSLLEFPDRVLPTLRDRGICRVTMARMNNLELRLLERAYAEPGLTIGRLADTISRGHRAEQEVRYLVARGYLLNVGRGLELSNKGLACIDSASLRNRTKRVGKGLVTIALSVAAVVIGNWLWALIQSSL